MVYKGHIKNGVVVFDEQGPVPEGVPVEVRTLEEVEQISDFARSLLELAGKAKTLPPDAALNHDHYLYGTPKK